MQPEPDFPPDLPEEIPPEPPESETTPTAPEVEPFQILGYDRGRYFYLPAKMRQVRELTGPEHTDKNMMTLAPLQWWERHYPGKTGPQWKEAANAMFRLSERVGVYNPGKIRGRGAWEDAGRSVLHLGDHLVVNGRPMDLAELQTAHIYEAAARMDLGVDSDPLTSKESYIFAELCRRLPWEKPISATLLAGWCVVAPICGALKWRPHIWITGPSGSGKSWVVDNLVNPMLGPTSLGVLGSSTEAGLRQTLKFDARPVMFDEAEGEDKQGQQRIKATLELMRGSSTETGASILKGSTNGQAQEFKIRSCFALSSIGVGLEQYADISRVSVLSLTVCANPSMRRHSEELHAAILSDDSYFSRMRARSVVLLPTILSNAATFGRAAAGILRNQRFGDQLGVLVAGAHSLYRSSEVSIDEARDWLEKQDLADMMQTDTRDELRCLARILEYQIRVEGDNATHDLTVGETILAATGKGRSTHEAVPPKKAERALRSTGIRTDVDVFFVSRTHSGVARILRDTPWCKNWGMMMLRIDGAKSYEKSLDFAGSSTRAIQLPLTLVGGSDDSDNDEQAPLW